MCDDDVIGKAIDGLKEGARAVIARDALIDAIGVYQKREACLREALEDMVYQHVYWADSKKGSGLWTGGLSANEAAFEALGWGDPHPAPDIECDEPGCRKRGTCGAPTEDGYRRTCGDHWPKPKE